MLSIESNVRPFNLKKYPASFLTLTCCMTKTMPKSKYFLCLRVISNVLQAEIKSILNRSSALFVMMKSGYVLYAKFNNQQFSIKQKKTKKK